MDNDDFRDMTRQFLGNVLEYADEMDRKPGIIQETLEGTQYRQLTVQDLQFEYPEAYVQALQELEFDNPTESSESIEELLLTGPDVFVEDMADRGRLKWFSISPVGDEYKIVAIWVEEKEQWDTNPGKEESTFADVYDHNTGDLERIKRRVTH